MALTSTTTFATAPDGSQLAAHLFGDGSPLLCLPGGPLLDSGYLGDLGGLSAHRQLALLDPRGTGASDPVGDPAAWRCNRLIADVEAQRQHLGLDRVDLVAHSAGANLAYRYAEHHPERIGRLVLVTPSVLALGIEIPGGARKAVAGLRSGEPWYPEAAAALASIRAGTATEATWSAITPFTYGRWGQSTQAYDAEMEAKRIPAAAPAFVADGAFDPPSTRAALAALDVPVLVLAGAWDVANPPTSMAQVADVFLVAGSSCSPARATSRGWTTQPGSVRRSAPSWPSEGQAAGAAPVTS